MTHADLLRAVSYDPETGSFRWLAQRPGRCKPGAICGSIDAGGHRRIRVLGESWLAHRLAWFYVTGTAPVSEIDHKNRLRDDNRFCNLREASRLQNNHNKSQYRSNSSGFIGVVRHKGRWEARVQHRARMKYLGSFPTAEEAGEVAQLARDMLYGAFSATHQTEKTA